jgi:O-antigen/teichoic acid export membrane protein
MPTRIISLLGRKTAIKDIAFSAMPQVMLALTSLVIAILLARELGPMALGSYALIISVTGLITVISESGLNQAALKFASHAAARQRYDQQHAVLRWALHCRILIWMLATLLACAVLPWVAQDIWKAAEINSLFYWGLLIPLFTAFSAMPTLYYQSGRNFRKSSIIASLQGILTMSAITALWICGKVTLENIVYVNIASAGVHALIAAYNVPAASLWPLELGRRGNKKNIDQLWEGKAFTADTSAQESQRKFTMLITATSLVVMVTTRLDIWLLGFFTDKETVGIYTVAFRATLPLTIGLAALNTMLWPRASALDDITEVKALLARVWQPILIAALVSGTYSIFAPYFIPLLFGSEFSSAVFLSQILCLRYCIAILTCPLGVIGYSLGLAGFYLFVNLIQLIAVLAINFLLMPTMGVFAAAIALLVNETIGAVIIGSYIRRIFNSRV